MRIRITDELLLLNLLVIVLILAIIFFPSNILRIILGLPFIFFFPGYALVAALFPRRGGLGSVRRVAFGFGLSIAVVTVIGLIINSTTWGISLESILWTIGSFTIIMTVVAWLRRKRLPEGERFGIEFTMVLFNWGKGIQSRVLSIILVLAVLGVLGVVSYAIAKPKVGQKFTEFYILGSEDRDADYPETLNTGQEGNVTIGIVNHEYQDVSYRVEVLLNGIKDDEVGPVRLEQDEKYEETVTFTLYQAGNNQKIEFLLYKNGDTEPYLEPLRLWIDVKS